MKLVCITKIQAGDKEKLFESEKAYGKSPCSAHLKAVAEGRIRY